MLLTRLLAAASTALASIALVATAQLPASAAQAATPTPGTGWYLAVVDRGDRRQYGLETTSQTVELVSPTGQRSVLLTGKVSRRGSGYLRIGDWSADGRTALVLRSDRKGYQDALVLDLPTGTQRTVDLGDDTTSTLLAPDGDGLLVQSYGDKSGAPVSRLSWTGQRTALGSMFSQFMVVDATTIIGGVPSRGAHALQLVDTTTGAVRRTIATPGAHCDPVRRWDPTRLLVTCSSNKRGSFTQDLRLVDPAAGTVAQLSLRHPRKRGLQAYGDIDARQLGTTTYLQVAGPCGVVYLARQRPDGSLVKVGARKAVGNILLIGTSGTSLVVQHAMSCDGDAPRSVLALLDPATKAETPLVSLRGREAFGTILPYGEPRASAY